MWPFPTKQLSAYLSTQNLLAWEVLHLKRRITLEALSSEQLQELSICIGENVQLPPPFKQHKTTLRLAPSLGRCYTLQAANTKLGSSELKGLAEHWGKTFMGPSYNAWQWQAIQVQPGHPILLCACKVDAQHLKVFHTVKPELLNLLDYLKAKDSAWIICRDEQLVQSALCLHGSIASILTWPGHYTSHAKAVIEKHMLLSGDIRGANIHVIFESRLGEVKTHGEP